jgi:hypothetical protein
MAWPKDLRRHVLRDEQGHHKLPFGGQRRTGYLLDCSSIKSDVYFPSKIRDFKLELCFGHSPLRALMKVSTGNFFALRSVTDSFLSRSSDMDFAPGFFHSSHNPATVSAGERHHAG